MIFMSAMRSITATDLLKDALGGGLVAGFDRLAHALDRGAQEVPESVAFYFSQ